MAEKRGATGKTGEGAAKKGGRKPTTAEKAATGTAGSGAPTTTKKAEREANRATAGGATTPRTPGGKKAGAKQADLRQDLRDFASARPQGWEHQDWLAFLDHLKARGHDTSDPDAIGMELERERLATALAQVPGVGPQRRDALVQRFDTLWSLRNASIEQITETGVPRALAEKIKQAV